MYMMIRSLLIPCKSDVTIFDLRIGEVFQIKHYIANIKKKPQSKLFCNRIIVFDGFFQEISFHSGFN